MKTHNPKVFSVLLALTMPLAAHAAFQEGTDAPDVLIGADNDNVDNPVIQPGDSDVDQSVNNTDIQEGRGGNDVLIGLLGNDVQLGGTGNDV